MDSTQFFAASRLIIVAGKGGVGKTTASAALAVAAARSGLSVLLVELEGKTGLSRLLGCEPLGYEPVQVPLPGEVTGSLTARLITPDEALLDYLADHGLKRVGRAMVSSGILEIVSTSTPGIRDLLVLGKIRQLETEGAADLIILDAPAAGHAITFLRSATGIAEAATSGALHSQATEALAMLGDPTRTRVMLATLPEETPINELIEHMSAWIVWLPGDQVALVDTTANELLRRAFRELDDPVAPSVRSIPIRASATPEAAVVHVVPATGRARDLFDGALGILVITPVSGSSAPGTKILQALFDLTPSEARVAEGIAEGVSLDQMAARHSVTIDTVRAQAKAVFAKTGTHRQAQVAALLVGLLKMPLG